MLPLTVQVTCRTAPNQRGRRHPVTIEPDWTLTTPHDLDAERLAAALGGYLTCLDVIDHGIPVLRGWLGCLYRRGPLPIAPRGTQWVVCEARACCRRYDSVRAAATHVRSLAHHLNGMAVSGRLLRPFAEQVTEPAPDFAVLAGLVPNWTARELWDSGLHPEKVAEVHRGLGLSGDTPAELYVAALVGDVDLSWLRRTSGGDPQTAVRLARNYRPADRRRPHERRRWMDLGASDREAQALMSHGDPDEVMAHCSDTGRDPSAVVRVMARWALAGYRLPPGSTAEVADTWAIPSPAAVARLQAAADRPLDNDEAALHLTRHGTVAAAAAALQKEKHYAR